MIHIDAINVLSSGEIMFGSTLCDKFKTEIRRLLKLRGLDDPQQHELISVVFMSEEISISWFFSILKSNLLEWIKINGEWKMNLEVLKEQPISQEMWFLMENGARTLSDGINWIVVEPDVGCYCVMPGYPTVFVRSEEKAMKFVEMIRRQHHWSLFFYKKCELSGACEIGCEISKLPSMLTEIIEKMRKISEPQHLYSCS